MKKLYNMFAAALLAGCLCLAGCGAQGSSSEQKNEKKTETSAVSSETAESEKSASEELELLSGVYTAELVIKDHGTITFEMDADLAPITVTNFVTLAESGFYDGLTFHRIIDGFMMQGGDPKGNGTGGSDHTIKGEFKQNGVANDQSHTRGAVSMARARQMDSASSQFFIVHQDSTFLDDQYACFGYVTDGMEVVDEICETTPVVDNNGSVKPENQPVIESVRILSE